MKHSVPSIHSDQKILGTDLKILDFWSWGFSNLLTNNLRGVFAEFIVGSALGVLDQPRIEWDAFDLIYKEKKIEVKSSAFVQAWHTTKYSNIVFNIGAKKSYDYTINKYSEIAVRNADIYVFCLLKEKDIKIIDPLNMNQWDFYIIKTQILNELFPIQKTLSLKSLEQLSQPISYNKIKELIDKL